MNKPFLLGTTVVLASLFWFIKTEKQDYTTNGIIENSDTLKTDTTYFLEMNSNTTFEFDLNEILDEVKITRTNEYTNEPRDTISLNFGDYKFPWEVYSFDDFKPWYGFNVKEEISIPEELNLHSSNSTNVDLEMLKSHSLERIENSGFFAAYGWDAGGADKLRGIFHEFMNSKKARELIFSSIIKNYNLIENKLTVFQKKVFSSELKHLIFFCDTYSLNRNKYLNGNTSVLKDGYDYSQYGYETKNEGFIFRRIEVDNIPASEISQFLKDLLKIVNTSCSNSKYFSNASSSINNGELIVNSYINAKGEIGFLLHSSLHKNSFFIPMKNIYITRLQSNGNSFWRIKDLEETTFFVLDSNLKKIK